MDGAESAEGALAEAGKGAREVGFDAGARFKAAYQRNNKKGGKKHLRCFPCCGPNHKSSHACEVPLRVRFAAEEPLHDGDREKFVALARFLPLHEDGTVCDDDVTDKLGDIALNQEMTSAQLSAFERSAENPFLPLYRARGTSLELPCSLLFEFREKAFHYSWLGGRYKQHTKHVLRVYIMRGGETLIKNGHLAASTKDSVTCVARISSPPFTVYSSRSAPSKTGAPPKTSNKRKELAVEEITDIVGSATVHPPAEPRSRSNMQQVSSDPYAFGVGQGMGGKRRRMSGATNFLPPANAYSPDFSTPPLAFEGKRADPGAALFSVASLFHDLPATSMGSPATDVAEGGTRNLAKQESSSSLADLSTLEGLDQYFDFSAAGGHQSDQPAAHAGADEPNAIHASQGYAPAPAQNCATGFHVSADRAEGDTVLMEGLALFASGDSDRDLVDASAAGLYGSGAGAAAGAGSIPKVASNQSLHSIASEDMALLVAPDPFAGNGSSRSLLGSGTPAYGRATHEALAAHQDEMYDPYAHNHHAALMRETVHTDPVFESKATAPQISPQSKLKPVPVLDDTDDDGEGEDGGAGASEASDPIAVIKSVIQEREVRERQQPPASAPPAGLQAQRGPTAEPSPRRAPSLSRKSASYDSRSDAAERPVVLAVSSLSNSMSSGGGDDDRHDELPYDHPVAHVVHVNEDESTVEHVKVAMRRAWRKTRCVYFSIFMAFLLIALGASMLGSPQPVAPAPLRPGCERFYREVDPLTGGLAPPKGPIGADPRPPKGRLGGRRVLQGSGPPSQGDCMQDIARFKTADRRFRGIHAHKSRITFALVVVAVALCCGLIASVYQCMDARHQRERELLRRFAMGRTEGVELMDRSIASQRGHLASDIDSSLMGNEHP